MTDSTPAGGYHHGDLRSALIETALSLLEREELPAVTLRRLARETGVSHAAPYHHFPDLNALLSAVAARGFDLLTEAMERGLAAGQGDPLQRLQGVGTAYVRFAVERPALFRLMFSGRWRDTSPYPELEEAEERAFLTLQSMTGSALPDGGSGDGVPAAARAAWALVHGIATLLVDGRMAAPEGTDPENVPEAVTRELTTVLGRGLRSWGG